MHDLTKEVAVSIAAFGKDLNNALLQGLMIGAAMAAGDGVTHVKHRRRPQELSPLTQTKHVTRHMELRLDSGGDEEEEAAEDCGFQSGSGGSMPLPVQTFCCLTQRRHYFPKEHRTLDKWLHSPLYAPAQYVGALSKKQRKVTEKWFGRRH